MASESDGKGTGAEPASVTSSEHGGAAVPSHASGALRPPAPPRDVLERVRRREPEALAVFFDHYFAWIYGVVFRMVGNRDVAEDMTQEVFLKVYRAANRLDPTRDPGAWLVAIAANTCRDLWRSAAQRMARRATPVDDAALRLVANPAQNPESDLIALERERLVQDAIVALPAPLRLSVVLRDYVGLSHDEVAAITGIQPAAARKRYSRALRLLAKRLKGVLES